MLQQEVINVVNYTINLILNFVYTFCIENCEGVCVDLLNGLLTFLQVLLYNNVINLSI